MTTTDNLLFYDIEIFKYNALVIFKDINKVIIRSYHNDFKGLGEFVKGKTLVGYNNYFYDDKMLTGMINQWSNHQLKELNDKLIRGEDHKHIHQDIVSLDCFQQIDVSRPGLKKVEGNMGKMILESAIDFNIDRPLTDEEFKETFEYCAYDIDMTIEIYKIRKHSYFDSKEVLLEMLGKPYASKWNTTTISANLLLDKPLPKWSTIRIEEDLLDLVPADVKDMWLQANNIGAKIKTKSTTITEFDNDIQFAFGGLHGAHRWIKRATNVILLDVASMYPSIIINNEVLGAATHKYREIRDERVQIKHEDKTLSDALKLILNSVYGNLRNKYSTLNNPRASMSVCIYGQIVLYELCKRLSQYVTIVNINTDGVMFTTDNDHYLRIWEDWEEEFGLVLEEEHFDLVVQKDVNNYIAVRDTSLIENNKIKVDDNIIVKGADTSKYVADKLFATNNTRIIDIAIVDYLINKKDVLDTLMENLDKPYLYQYILQAGPTYLGTYDEDGNKYNKINRVFASRKGNLNLQKKRKDGGLVKFANAPEKMFLWNDSTEKLENFKDTIDLNHYYQLVMTSLERWS